MIWNDASLELSSGTSPADAVYGEFISSAYDSCWYGKTSAAETAYYSDFSSVGCALEIGCGTGRLSVQLLRGGIDIHGIESSHSMLAMLHKKIDLSQRGRFLHWDARIVPYPIRSKSLDAVIIPFSTFAVLHNHHEPILDNRILLEIHRIIRPSGKLVINDLRLSPKPTQVPEPDSIEHLIDHPVYGMVRESWSGVYSIVRTQTIAFQILRRRTIRYVDVATGRLLSECHDYVPVWYPEDFPSLARATDFNFLDGQICHFYEHESMNYVFERPQL